jgi:hypothetical protein
MCFYIIFLRIPRWFILCLLCFPFEWNQIYSSSSFSNFDCKENIRDFISIVLQSQSFLYSSVLIFELAIFLLNLFILLFYRILIIILIAQFPFTVSLRIVALLLLFAGANFLFFSFFQAFLQGDLVTP